MSYIKQFKEFKYKNIFSNYSSLNHEYQGNISFLSYFFTSSFGYIKNDLESNISKLDRVDSMSWNDDEIVIDQKANKVYLGIVPDFCCDEIYDDIYEDKMAGKSLLQLYQENLLNHMIISKKNFIDLLRLWNQFSEKKVPFLLLYQNDNDLFYLKSFDAQEEMEAFVKNAKNEINY